MLHVVACVMYSGHRVTFSGLTFVVFTFFCRIASDSALHESVMRADVKPKGKTHTFCKKRESK